MTPLPGSAPDCGPHLRLQHFLTGQEGLPVCVLSQEAQEDRKFQLDRPLRTEVLLRKSEDPRKAHVNFQRWLPPCMNNVKAPEIFSNILLADIKGSAVTSEKPKASHVDLKLEFKVFKRT